jgi:hypothetical protein
MSTEEVIAAVAYFLAFILFDTIIIFLVLVIIGAIWPRKTAHQRPIFVSLMIFIHLLLGMIILRSFVTFEYPYVMIIAISTILIWIFIYRRYRTIKIATFLLSVANKVIILTAFYLLLNIAGLIIVVFRNI